MKAINKIITLIFGLSLLLMFATCTEKVNYSPADMPGNAQVYFSKDETSVSLVENQNSFPVNVYRQNTSGSLTVNISVNDENHLFTVPSSVTFADGNNKATFNVTFDFSKIEVSTDYALNLKLNSDTTAYAPAEVTLLIKYAPWSDWKLFGTGTYTYVGFFSGDDAGLKLYAQKSLINPNLYQFRLDNWGGGVSMQFNYDASTGNCTVPSQYIGYVHSTYGKVYFTDVVTYANVMKAGTSSLGKPTYADYPCTFNPETGVFSLSVVYWVYVNPSNPSTGPENIGSFGACVETLKLDGYTTYDYSMALSYLGHYIDLNGVDNAIVQFTKGADAASYKYAVVNGTLTATSAEDVANQINDGTLAFETDTQSGYKIFPFTDGGNYSVVAVSYDDTGAMQSFGYVTFEFYPAGMSSPWVSLGFCKYTDDLFVPMYSDDPLTDIPTYDVEILENQDNPGLFRLKNAYGAGYPYNEPGDYDENNVYIKINATDPNGVYIDYQSMGINWGDGTAYIYSYASYYMDNGHTFEEAKAAGYCGTYANNIITFPVKRLLINFEGSSSLYYGNTNGLWKVDMTSLRSSAAKSAPFRSNLSRSFKQKGAALNLKSIRPIKVKGKNVPAITIREKMLKVH